MTNLIEQLTKKRFGDTYLFDTEIKLQIVSDSVQEITEIISEFGKDQFVDNEISQEEYEGFRKTIEAFKKSHLIDKETHQ